MSFPVRVSSTIPPPSGRPPQVNLAPRHLEGLLAQLEGYHQTFASCFGRQASRQWALKYMEGQMLELERKSIEPMAQALVGGNIQAMQQFISDSVWSDEALILCHQQQVAHTLGTAAGVVILDGCDFPKQGEDSVGVARQYCGPLGKRANCQASVVLCYASDRGHTLLDRRLYVPQVWFTPAYAERRKKCGLPPALSFQTKNELGGAMLAGLIDRGVVPFQWVTMDEAFGRDTALLDHLHGQGKYFVAEIPRTTQVWRRRPAMSAPAPYEGVGRPATQPHLAPQAPAPRPVEQIAQALAAKQWREVIIHEGRKGPLVVQIACVRVVTVSQGLPDRPEWLVVRRASAQQPVDQWKFYRSNAPRTTPWKTLARLTAWRWPVESTIEECKSELGLDHYEVRGWTGWHHHTAMTLLSHHFLVRVRVEMGQQAPALTVSQVRRLLQVVLPKRTFDAPAALEELERIQRQNYAAYRAHRKRRRRELNSRAAPQK